jgi:hypothetical protein
MNKKSSDDRDKPGKGITNEEMESHLQRVWQRNKEVRSLVDEAKGARTKVLEKIVAQNLDPQLIAESVTRMEKALGIGFDPAHTQWPPPVLTTYIEPHEMLGHASILIDELFLDGRNTASRDRELSAINDLLKGLLQKHGEPLFSKIVITLVELLKQADRSLSTIQSNLGLGPKEFEEKTWYEYADYILPARDEIEYALEGLRLGGLEERFKDFRGTLQGFDERFRRTLPESARKYDEASGRYGLTGRDLEHYPQSFWWRRLGLTRKGEPIWR